MFCPNCRSEFRQSFTHCDKCNKDLVDKLDPLPQELPVEFDYIEMVTIAETTELFDISLARGALESANIRFNITNEYTQNLIVPSGFSGFGNPIAIAKIMVEKEKDEEARMIIEGILADAKFKVENDDDKSTIEDK